MSTDLAPEQDALTEGEEPGPEEAAGPEAIHRLLGLTDDEYEALRECLEELRAAQGGGSDPASA